MNGQKEVRAHYLVFFILGLLSIGIGILLCPDFTQIRAGLLHMILHPSLLSTDYMVVGQCMGASFVNAGLLVWATLLVYRWAQAKLQGLQVAALMMVFGYGFFGKNLFNVWPLVIGVMLASRHAGRNPREDVALAFFAASLSPLVSVLAVGTPLMIHASLWITVPISVAAGILGGFLIGRFSAYVRRLHHGASLYNGALSSGMVGILANFLLISVGLGHDRLLDNTFISGENLTLGLIVFGLSLYFILTGLILNKGFRGLHYFLGRSFSSIDFVYQFSLGKTLMNMGLVGLFCLLYVVLIPGAQLNGPVYGGLFTIVGFAAHGVTLPAMLPAAVGVSLGAFFTGGISGVLTGGDFLGPAIEKLGSRDMLVAWMFVGGFSPMTKMYGVTAAILAGFLHSITVTNIAPLHGWMVGYNNGFSMGLIAMLFFPMIEMMSKRDYFYKIFKGFLGKEQTEQGVLEKNIPS